jgi:hypothetical protein
MLHLRLIGEDGNAFAILGRASKLLRDHGLDKDVVDQFLAEARSGDYSQLLETCERWFTCDQTPSPDAILSGIATRCLDIETLETQNSDRLDFHEVSVWSLNEALLRAYDAGKSAAAVAPTSAVPIASLSMDDLAEAGFETRLITLGELRSLASDMADTYIEDRFWSDLEFFADEMDLPRI